MLLKDYASRSKKILFVCSLLFLVSVTSCLAGRGLCSFVCCNLLYVDRLCLVLIALALACRVLSVDGLVDDRVLIGFAF